MDTKTDRAIKERVDAFLDQTKDAREDGWCGRLECYHAARIGYWLAMRGKKEAARTAEGEKGAGK
jgi:hypothetical protein